MSKHSIAFMSYVRFDDQHEAGRLSELRNRLSGEIRLQTGEEFHIFQDRTDIAWGQQWKQRIDGSLDAVTFLIPIITPGFFKSQPCCDELKHFLNREKELEREDLILPVYYVNCPILNDESKREANPLAKVIAARQYIDWRELRFEPLTSPQVGRMIEKMATQIVEALERGQPATQPPLVSAAEERVSRLSMKINLAKSPQREEAGIESPGVSRGPVAKTEPPTRIVDAFHRGDHPTLGDALKAAKPGDRILIRPGLYREGIIIDKPIEIIGDGELGEVVIEAEGKNAVLYKANMGRIANLTLRQIGGGNWYCVDITQGRLDLEGCDITCKSTSCVAIHGGADPRLRHNRIHDSKQAGVVVYKNGLGTLEDNDIFGNAMHGVAIFDGGNPTLRRNRIYDGKMFGVHIFGNALGILEDNDIFSNATAGVAITEGSNPTLHRNRIHDCKINGIYVETKGKGTIEDNDILGNEYCGVAICKGGNPTLRRNRIYKNLYRAIWVYEGGEGIFEDNDLRGNTKGAWDIAADCLDKVKRARNKE